MIAGGYLLHCYCAKCGVFGSHDGNPKNYNAAKRLMRKLGWHFYIPERAFAEDCICKSCRGNRKRVK